MLGVCWKVVMTDRSLLVAMANQEAELRIVQRSDVRGKANQARAVLLILQNMRLRSAEQAAAPSI